jgi:hypothetical protein
LFKLSLNINRTPLQKQKNEFMFIKENVALSENGFVFNPSTGDSFTMNKTGKEVMMLIKDGKNISQITELMIEKYDVDSNTLERYLSDFLNDLSMNNLLEEEK